MNATMLINCILNLLCFQSTCRILHCMNIQLTFHVRNYRKRFVHSSRPCWYPRRYREANLHFGFVDLPTSFLFASLIFTYLHSASSRSLYCLGLFETMREAECISELTTEVSALIELNKGLIVQFNLLWCHFLQRLSVRTSESIFRATSA